MNRIVLAMLVIGCDKAKVTIDGSMLKQPVHDTGSETQDSAAPWEIDDDGDGAFRDTDCNDSDATIYPGADEICDGLDNDCDTEIDEEPVDGTSWYKDLDGDGYGISDDVVISCTAPVGRAELDGDCDDTLPDVHPGAEEICGDALDNNCDESVMPCVLSGILSLDEATVSVWGHFGYQRVGLGGAAFGDADGDGLDDLMLGVPDSNEYTHLSGAAYLFTDRLEFDSNLMDASAIIHGGALEAQAGEEIVFMGDLDADGTGDWAIGSPAMAGIEPSAGAIVVVRGPSIGIFSVDDAAFQFLGEETGDEAGAAATRIDDGDGDGRLRMAVGAPGARTESATTGVVYMVDFDEAGIFNLSMADVRLHGSFTGERAGASIDYAGDVNGDGHPDLLIGAPHRSPGPGLGNAGGAYLVYGPFESGALAERSVRIDGSIGGAKVGQSVAGVGDTDGDEKDDFVLGCLDCNAAYVFTEAPEATIGIDSASAVWTGENAGDYAGWCVAAAGDVNRDGLADILVGAKGNDFGDANAGAAYLLYGPYSGEQGLDTANAKFYGAQNNEQAGTLVLGGGDIDGDGFLEILVGSPLTDSPYEDAGRVSLFFGDARL